MIVPNLNGSPDLSALPTWAQDHVSGYTLVGDVYHAVFNLDDITTNL